MEISSLDKLLKDHVITQRTYDKVKIAKEQIERKYKSKSRKNKSWNKINKKINSFKLSNEDKETIKREIFHQEIEKYRKYREKRAIKYYNPITLIGSGAFGDVYLCRELKNGEIVAVKKMKKSILLLKNQVIHARNEQLFLSKVKSPWIVDLKVSFQEGEYLYLVMEYLPGGDLMNLLIKKDIFTENEAKFYMMELILAIDEIHKLDCIHRDIKPDNILIDKKGHIKLSDFGLAKISEKIFNQKKNYEDEEFLFNDLNESEDSIISNTHEKNFSCVGTAYYVAPEVLSKKGYGKEIDWWSAGAIFYEMLVGYAPFCSKDTKTVCKKILNFEKYLKIPKNIEISNEANDLIFKLINNADKRLGINGVEEIKKHPFFKDADWENIRHTKAPFIPELKDETDTKYFDKFEEKEPFHPVNNGIVKRKDIEFLDYSYQEDFQDDDNIIYEFQNAVKSINGYQKLLDNNNSYSNNNFKNNKNNENNFNNFKNIYNSNNRSLSFNNRNKNKKLLFNKLNSIQKTEYEKNSNTYNISKIPDINLHNSKIKNLKLNRSSKKVLKAKLNDIDSLAVIASRNVEKSPPQLNHEFYLQKLSTNKTYKQSLILNEKANYSYFNRSNNKSKKNMLFQNISKNSIKRPVININSYSRSGKNNDIYSNIKQIFTQTNVKVNCLYKKSKL